MRRALAEITLVSTSGFSMPATRFSMACIDSRITAGRTFFARRSRTFFNCSSS